MKNLKVEEVKAWIKNSKRICLIFHIDSDGITSAYLMEKVIQKLGRNVDVHYASAVVAPDYALYEKARKNDLIIFVDLNVDSKPHYVKKLAEENKVIIIDHHILFEDLNSENIIHVSTKFISEDYYPACFFIYNLFEEYLEDYDWVAAIGLIGDVGAKLNPKFMNRVLKKYSLTKGEMENYEDTELGKFDFLVGGARMYSGGRGAMKALKILLECETIEEFKENSAILQGWHNKVQRELNAKLDVFEMRVEKRDKLMYCHMPKTKYNIGSPLSTVISRKYEDKLVVLTMNVNADIVKIHAKSSDRSVNTREFLGRVLEGFKGSSFGGHDVASGGSFRAKDLKKFQRRVFEEAESL